MNIDKKTYELLLLRYNEMHSAILKPCAEKEKFATLIKEVEQHLENAGKTIVYSGGLSVLEYATKLAKEANERTNTVPEKSWSKMNEEELKSPIAPDPDIEYTSDEWCSCGHRKLDCDCKAGCKCGCNSRFLRAY